MAQTTVNGINTGKKYPTGNGATATDKLKQAVVNASQRTANERGGMNGMFNPGTVTGRNSVGEIVTNHRKPTAPSGGGGGGGGETVAPSYSVSAGSGGDDIIAKIKALLEEQKKQADEYANSLYSQEMEQIKQAGEKDRNNANLNYYRTNKWLNNLYGDVGHIYGQGYSNRGRNASNWMNNIANIRMNQSNNEATAKSRLNANLMNNAQTLANNWSSAILPYYVNQADREAQYRYAMMM